MADGGGGGDGQGGEEADGGAGDAWPAEGPGDGAAAALAAADDGAVGLLPVAFLLRVPPLHRRGGGRNHRRAPGEGPGDALAGEGLDVARGVADDEEARPGESAAAAGEAGA